MSWPETTPLSFQHAGRVYPCGRAAPAARHPPALAGTLGGGRGRERVLCPAERRSFHVSGRNTVYLLEELSPAQWPVEDLRQADFHLPDRQSPVVARLSVCWTERQRNPAQPFAEYPVDVFRPQPIADL